MAQSKRFSSMRYTAATEDAAFAGALDLVGVSREEAEYEVLDVSDKGVTIRIKPRETQETAPPSPVVSEAPVVEAAPEFVPAAQAPVEETTVEAAPVAEEVEDEEDEADSEIEAQLIVEEDEIPTLEEENEAVEEDEDAEEGVEVEVYEDEAEEVTDEDVTEDEDESTEEEGEESSIAEEEAEPAAAVSDEIIAHARETAQQFLEKMGMDANCIYETGATSTTVPLSIEGNDVGILIGKHGSTLQAFQYLLNLTVNNGNEPDTGVRVVVDAGNYRARRQNSLEQTARAAAQRARMSGRPVRLDAMPASERRIIHMFLQNEPGVTTQSEGREPQRRLVIFPAQSGGGNGRYEERGERRGMGGFNRGRGGRGFRR